MKRSREIVLALIASVSLTACGPDTQTTQRDMYKNRDDCVKDWNENVAGKQQKSEETIKKQSRMEQRNQDCERTFGYLEEFKSRAIFY